MPPDFVGDSELWGALFAAGVFGAGLLLAGVILVSSNFILKHRTDPDPLDNHIPLDILLLSTLKGPLVLFILVLGILLGLMSGAGTFESLSWLEEWIRRIWLVAAIGVVSYLVSHLIHFTLDWYVKSYAARTGTHLDDLLLPPLRRILPVTVYSVGILLALSNVGISISPVLAGLGIGGLAMALALQPTLGNLFAGAYLMAERELREGDYIRLDQGLSGYIVGVGWRSTKIRTFCNTLIVIPNSKLADTIITNYYHPGNGMYIMLTGGVSYENDLGHVKRVVIDEIQKLVDESPHAVKEYKPWFGFEKFGESNVEFWIYYEATNLMGTFYLTSDGIKRLHARFKTEGIKRNYPVREIIYPATDGQITPSEPQGTYAQGRSARN